MTAIDEQNGPARANVVATDVEGEPRKLPYPKAIGFIISNEFCERFCYYGMRTILVLYLTRKQSYDDDTATIIYHVFTMLVYFMCTFGAILSDSWLGKFNTILYLSVVYVLGTAAVALGAIPDLNLPGQTMTILGLCLIALGSGGIKPCVAAFGGDQFEMPAQAKHMATFFSLFYFSINSGSLISSFITPILREDVHCFGEEDCYSLAFGVPGLLMITSILIFLIGKFLYKIVPPSGNMVVLVSRCIWNAIATRWRSTDPVKPDHWLQYAEPAYGKQIVHDTRILLNILVLYIPLPVFWALFDQQGSRWTFQATRMNGDIGFYEIKPDQMLVINPLLILIFIPLYDVLFYPLLSKIGVRRPLQKLALGGIFAGVAFLASAFVELQLENTYPVLPQIGETQFRVYNPLPCNFTVSTSVPLDGDDAGKTLSFELPAHLAYQDRFSFVGGFSYSAQPAVGSPAVCTAHSGRFELADGKAHSYVISSSSDAADAQWQWSQFIDDPAKSRSGQPVLRVLHSNLPATSRISVHDVRNENSQRYSELASNRTRVEVVASQLEIRVDGQRVGEIELRLGAVATVLLSQEPGAQVQYHLGLVYLTEANSVHMLWLLPQYVIMTLGEVMFSVTGLAFSYAQAPVSMKSVLQAMWLLTVAFGNVIDIIVVGASFFDSQASEFFLFAGLMFVDMLLFMYLAYRYKPSTLLEVEGEEGAQVTEELIAGGGAKGGLSGIDNVAFSGAAEKEKQ